MSLTIVHSDIIVIVCSSTLLTFFLTASTPKSNAFYGQGSGKIWLNSVHCTGFETRLVDCQFNSNTAGLTHQDDAGVICKHSGRL